ncbi:MAG TPA: LamG-like jellyroll fold domain-containing protein, partial [Verrucomicrobiae bacterium]|nr:LamG-like jellyroll fold domain-containing protein [Verrucomicrobiae bacterium]
GGQILCGDGSPDVTATSTNGYNNSAPHVMTFKRVQSTGVISLYVDGALASSVTGTVASLTSPPRLVIGAQQELSNFFSGDIAEMRIYSAALDDPNREFLENALIAKYITGTNGAGPTIPSAPTGLTASPGNGEVGLSWSASAGATSYNIMRSTFSGGPYTLIATRVATLHMDLGLSPGTYYYVVSAANTLGTSGNSAQASATVVCNASPAPTGLAISAEDGQIILAWMAVGLSPGATGYNILRSTNNGGPFATIATNVQGTNYVDGTIFDKSTYYYVVEAVNSCGTGPASAVVSASLSALNIQPLLSPVVNQTILAGRILQIQNNATDVNSPPQTLHYSLLTSPAGAGINPITGLFNWRPAIAQAGGTYPMGVAVFNNGLPSLGVTQNFTVSVLVPAQPVFGAPTWSNGIFQSSISGDTGPDYSVLSSTDLANWTQIFTTNSPPTPWLFTDFAATNNGPRFYRVQLGP